MEVLKEVSDLRGGMVNNSPSMCRIHRIVLAVACLGLFQSNIQYLLDGLIALAIGCLVSGGAVSN